MKPLSERLREFLEFDESEARSYADSLDSTWDKPNAYAHYLAGAYSVKDRTANLDAWAGEMAAALETFNRRFSPGENWYPEFRELLDKLEQALERK